MNGYSNVFNNAILNYDDYIKNNNCESLFKNFRTARNIYGFITNGDTPPDQEAINISQNINSELYQKYVQHNSKQIVLGYGDYAPHFLYNNLDSRHIMMSIILFENIEQPINNILEIGGGYGGWLRLNYGIQEFNTWHIIDLLHLNLLQEWYLNNHSVPRNIYKLHQNTTYKNTIDNYYDLIIGTHSLSELDINIFNDYYENIIKKSKYLFYACHNKLPAVELINKKLEIINNDFNLIINVLSENNNVSNYLFINKNIQ